MSKTSKQLKKLRRPAKKGGGGLLTGLGVIAGGWIAYSTFAINHETKLPEAITAERTVIYSPRAGRLSYYADTSAEGRPLVLLHSINAAASAYEMRPLFEHYRSQRPVYALDLPGYGFSERSKRVYHPELFANAIQDFLAQQVGQPADVVALSLTAEFAARAAAAQPELFHSLTLISPTGFSERHENLGSQAMRSRGLSNILYPLYSFPLWGRPFFDLISTQASIKFFLEQSFVGPVPESLIDYDYATSHQPGAENVPLYFISGKLFTPDVKERFYQQLHVPTLVVYDHDPFTKFDTLPDLLSKNSSWRAVRIIPTMGLPHWDQLPQTVAALDDFWSHTQA